MFLDRNVGTITLIITACDPGEFVRCGTSTEGLFSGVEPGGDLGVGDLLG